MDHSPSLVSVQLMENRVVTVFKHQVKLPLLPEDFNKADKVGVLELLKTRKARVLNVSCERQLSSVLSQ